MMDLLKSEYLKFFYNRWLQLTFFSTVVLVPFLIVYLHETPSEVTKNYVLSQILESLYLGQSGFIIITILFLGQEFNSSTLRSSFLASPNRKKFIFAKLFVLLSVLLLMWCLITLSSTIVIQTFYRIVISRIILWYIFKIIIVSITLIIVCSGLVLLTKSVVFSIGLSLLFLLGLGQMMLQFSRIFLYFPILSTMNAFLVSENIPYLTLMEGIMIQLIWGVILLFFSIFLLERKSIR